MSVVVRISDPTRTWLNVAEVPETDILGEKVARAGRLCGFAAHNLSNGPGPICECPDRIEFRVTVAMYDVEAISRQLDI